MTRGMGRSRVAVAVSAALVCALMSLAPLTAFALAPHVATGAAPDTCAMCHRAHTGGGSFGVVDPDSWEMTGSALALGLPSDAGDTQLCYVCHHVDALGSGLPVAGAFEETSAHSLAPTPSPFGPTVKYCSSCHDSHGTKGETPDTPYAKLLRSRSADGTRAFQGSAYCGTCHTVRPASGFDGVAVYEQTAHYTKLPDPVSGTKIRCSICHESHGSPIAPLIVSEIASPSVAATVTVTANDRTLCFACHADPLRTYAGKTVYATSAHAAASTLTTITGEWPESGAKRRVGECQVCHAPMGADDGTGAPIASLLEVKGSALCLTCHDADGVAQTDLDAARYPAAAAPHLEIVAGFSPETTTSAFGTVAVWGTDPAQAAPRPVVGPRFFSAEGTSGAMAVGDIDGDGAPEVLVADRGTARLTVFEADPLKGLSSYVGPGARTLVVGGIADHVLVTDIVGDAAPEICVLSGDTLHLYRYDPILDVLFALDAVSGLGADVTGLAAGDLDGDGRAEVVVTDAAAPAIHVLTESGTTPGTLTDMPGSPVAAHAGVRGPSVGAVDAVFGTGLVVANADEAADHITVYDATLAERASYSVDATTGAKPWATLVADVLPVPASPEVSVAVNGGTDVSSVNVFKRLGAGGLGVPLRYDTGVGAATGSLAAGDIDGDAHVELVAGNGGTWGAGTALAVPPSLSVFQHTATLDEFVATPQRLPAGGAERAGQAPQLAVVDLGGVGPSRHPVGAVADAHAAGETPPFTRHVECADCHDAHEATSTAGVRPGAYGRITGTSGASVTNTGPGSQTTFTDTTAVAYEYELCLKCHSAYVGTAGREGAADIAAEVNAKNASVHAVQAAVTVNARSGSFVAPWDNGSMLYCIDCHTAAGAPAVAGPHTSSEAPILKRPYLGVSPDDPAGLCYDCHRFSVYYSSVDDTLTAASWFSDAADGPLHGLHVRDHGFGCAACHASHGSPTNERLVREAIGYLTNASGGSCVGPCHPGGVSYVR